MDFCDECGVAVDVEQRDGITLYLCRNPQCSQFGKALEEEKQEEK